jgi:hypothetical protein
MPIAKTGTTPSTLRLVGFVLTQPLRWLNVVGVVHRLSLSLYIGKVTGKRGFFPSFIRE